MHRGHAGIAGRIRMAIVPALRWRSGRVHRSCSSRIGRLGIRSGEPVAGFYVPRTRRHQRHHLFRLFSLCPSISRKTASVVLLGHFGRALSAAASASNTSHCGQQNRNATGATILARDKRSRWFQGRFQTLRSTGLDSRSRRTHLCVRFLHGIAPCAPIRLARARLPLPKRPNYACAGATIKVRACK